MGHWEEERAWKQKSLWLPERRKEENGKNGRGEESQLFLLVTRSGCPHLVQGETNGDCETRMSIDPTEEYQGQSECCHRRPELPQTCLNHRGLGNEVFRGCGGLPPQTSSSWMKMMGRRRNTDDGIQEKNLPNKSLFQRRLLTKMKISE